MKEQCLWHAISPLPSLKLGPLAGEQSTDVVIIGGGITGLSTALHLAEAGVSVTLIDSDDIPSGGSGKSVGLVNAGLWIPPDDIVKALGEEQGERANTLLGNAPSEVFALIERFAMDCQATRTGTLHLAHNRSGEKELGRRAEQLQRRGAPVELVEDDACWQKTGTTRIRRALLDSRAGTVNPAAYTRGLANAAQSLGARLYTQTPALSLKRQGDQWQVITPQGHVTAPQVVLATNAYSEDEWNQVRGQFFPGYFFQVATQPLTQPEAEAILPERQGAWDTRLVLSSMRRDAEGRLLLGSLGRGSGRPQAYVRSWANRIQRHYFPQLGKVTWEFTWSGRIAFTPDHTLRLFQPAPGILAATGYNGRGITTGTVVGKGFARYLTHHDDTWLPLSFQPARPIKSRPLWSTAYEGGFTLYHAGQCLRVLI